MSRSKRTVAVVAVAVVAAALAIGVWWRWGNQPRELLRPGADQQPWVELGRGSGWFGLNTVRIEKYGSVILYRLRDEPATDG
jgi:hypothetical protein